MNRLYSILSSLIVNKNNVKRKIKITKDDDSVILKSKKKVSNKSP